MANNDDVFDGGAFRRGSVRIEFHRDAAAGTAKGGVLRNQHLALGIVDAVSQRLRREGAENDGVHRADTGACQHRNRQLGHHLQVDADAIAFPDAVRFQDVGEAFHLTQQFAVGEGFVRRRIVALPDDGGVVAVPSFNVTVKAVVAGVQFSALKPRYVCVDKVILADVIPLLEPRDSFGDVFPERLPDSLGILRRFLCTVQCRSRGRCRWGNAYPPVEIAS